MDKKVAQHISNMEAEDAYNEAREADNIIIEEYEDFTITSTNYTSRSFDIIEQMRRA